MDFGGFVVQGSRPPSAQSSHRPRSARNKHGYHTVSYQSSVDETLFSAHHPTKMHEPLTDFKAPWEYPKPKPMGNTFAEPKMKLHNHTKKPKPKGRPLLWAPMAEAVTHSYKKKDVTSSISSQSSMNDTNQFWNSREQFRHLKHTPTFVDESLFGNKLEESTFEAPWNEKPKGQKKKIYLWDTFGRSADQAQNGLYVGLEHNKYHSHGRPKTALGISRNKSQGSKAVPVWKP